MKVSCGVVTLILVLFAIIVIAIYDYMRHTVFGGLVSWLF